MNEFTVAVDTTKHIVQNVNLLDAVMIECSYNDKFSQFMFSCVPYSAGQDVEENKFPKLRTTQTGTLVEYILNNVKYKDVAIDVSPDLIKVFEPKFNSDPKCPRLFITFKKGEIETVSSQNINSDYAFKTMLYGFKNMVEETTVNTIVVSNIQQMMFALQSAALNGMPGMEKKTKSGVILPGRG